MKPIEQRREILFLYETKDCNPNGDPLDENKPRMDPDTEQALVTDVRIKRTIRDYIFHVKGHDILVRDTFDDEGYLNTSKGRAQSMEKDAGLDTADKIPEAVRKLEEYITSTYVDARMFGAALPFTPPGDKKKEASVQITGPVQFLGFARSLHRVSPMLVQGTAAFASKKKDIQKSFREDYVLPYACIAAYGIANEIAARTTGMTDDDMNLLLESLWHGTQSLHSRSKIGHKPLLLLVVRHKGMHQVGDLLGLVKLQCDLDDLEIRNTGQYKVDVTRLVDALESAKDNLASIEVSQDPHLALVCGDREGSFSDIASDRIPVKDLW